MNMNDPQNNQEGVLSPEDTGQPEKTSLSNLKSGEEPITTISFKHGFFHSVAGTFFKQLDDTGDAVMIMPLEGGDVSLKLGGIKHELDLKPGDHDAKVLDIISEALNYVRGIKEGEPVPSELLTGHASWEVSKRDRETAHNRVTMQLVSWMSGDEVLVTEPDQLAQIVEDPVTRTKINEAFLEAAESLGLGKDRREDVISLVGNLAEELAYIETLRQKFHKVETIHKIVSELEQKYKAEQSVMEVIVPVMRLFKIALDGLHESFDEIDAQTGEILSVLKNIAAQTKFIRQARDDLHRRLWAWESQIEEWGATMVKRSQHNEYLLDEL
ncbi:MAG: hypothetical protein ISR45_11020, partial [Rhodospirillales bacterium]|nr:hypothetical protein [Rhodospirillales bacterium]